MAFRFDEGRWRSFMVAELPSRGDGETGRVGEWESGRVGEWESGRVGEKRTLGAAKMDFPTTRGRLKEPA